MALGTYPVITLPNGYRLSLFNVIGAKLSGTVLIFDFINSQPLRYECGSDTVANTLIAAYDALVGSVLLSNAPTITGVAPNSVSNATGGTPRVTGTNLLNGGIITVGGYPTSSPVYSFDNTYIDITIGAGTIPVGGPYDVVYTGPDGQTVTDAASLTITA